MAIRKRCKTRGCTQRHCDHPWWLDVQHNGVRVRMPVDDFALPRMAEPRPIRFRDDAKHWEAQCLAELRAGKDPRQAPARRSSELTVGGLIALYAERYVEAEPLKSRASARSRLKILKAHMGDLPATALEQPQTIEDFKSAYVRKPATINRFLSQLRHMIGWAIGRGLLERSPFGRYGLKVRTKAETRRERRLSSTEEEQLLKACDELQERPRHWHLGTAMRDRIIGALDTCCRQGEMLLIRNADVDWQKHWISIRAEHAKDGVGRRIPFEEDGRLANILERRRFLGREAFVFGDINGAFVKNFRTAWETVLLVAHDQKPTREDRKGRVDTAALKAIDLHWHDLRHEGLSRLAEAGMPAHELQRLAGHANLATTNRYLNARDEQMAESLRRARQVRATA